MRISAACSLLALLAGCAADPPPPAQAPAPPPPPAPVATADKPASAPPPATARQLATDTTVTTSSGATFLAPKGWWLTQNPDAIVLEDPDRALKTTFVETSETDPLKAIDATWQKAEPGFALKRLHEPQSPPPIRGWDSITDTDYETKSSEHRTAAAEARRYGNTTYVAVTDADTAALGRRGAQLVTALWTFTPNGMHEESFKGKTPRPIDAARAKELDAFIESARTKFGVTGAAVGIVEGGKVVYEKGFGARALGKKDAVTPATLFLIASITKSMTTMMEATLVDAKKVGWETPVTEILPTFALGDADVTKKLHLWNTACACTGMPRRDMELLFDFAKATPEERMAAMKTMTPTTGFGETFQYSNMMVAAGGFAAAHAYDPKRPLGDAYDAVMKKNIFEPIGMKSTTLDFAVAERGEHAASIGDDIDGTPHTVPLSEERGVFSVRPAGGVWSNVRDMDRYVMTEMAKGVSPDGKRVVSEENLLERRKPRVRVSDTESYGLGLMVGTFRDLPMLTHDGGAFGFATSMFMLPEQGIAVVMLTNSTDGWALNAVVQRKVMEEVFEGAKELAAPRVEFFSRQLHETIAKAVEKLNREPDAAWVKGLAGTYACEGLGKVTLAAGPKGGTFDAGEWKSAFAQKKEDDGTVKIVLTEPPLTGMQLVVAGEGDKTTLTINDEQAKYVFQRAK
jgi:CubicO group peptidase (beta-lactamase class C family)